MLILTISQHVLMGLHLLKINLSMCSIHMIPNNILFALDHVKMNDQKLVGLMHVFWRRSQPIQDRLGNNYLILFFLLLTHITAATIVIVVVAAAAAAISIHCLNPNDTTISIESEKIYIRTLNASYTRRYLACNIYIHIYIKDGACALGNNGSIAHRRCIFHHVFIFLLRPDKMINNKWWRQNRKREENMTFSVGTH